MFHFGKRRVAAFAGDIERIKQELGEPPLDALLDVGGGSGEITLAAAARASRVVVVEPNRRKRMRGANRSQTVEFIDGRAEALPVPDATFDRVVSIVAFHHFPDQAAALQEMKRVMTPGGRLLIFEMDPSRAPGRGWGLLVGHTHFHEASGLCVLIAAAGFRDLRTVASPSGYIVTAQKP